MFTLSPNGVEVFFRDPDGIPAQWVRDSVLNFSAPIYSAVAAGDIDYDGRAEMFILSPYGVEVFFRDPDGIPAQWVRDSVLNFSAPVYSAVAAGDIDNDGRAEMFILSPNGVEVFFRDPDGIPAQWVRDSVLNFSAPVYSAVAAGDIDNDGRAEMFILSPYGVEVFFRDPDGIPAQWVRDSYHPATDLTVVAAGDINNDGGDEMFVFPSTSGISVGATDATPPALTPPANISAQCMNGVAAGVVLGTPTVTDNRDRNPVVTNDAPGVFPYGTTIVTWRATDSAGNYAEQQQTVSVVDTQRPTFITVLSPVNVIATDPTGTTR
jgi:catechol 2,3-dioxygenase-like lactoylglutathione lyase family enzyme